MYSDWFNEIEKLQGRLQHGKKVGYCYPSGLEKTLCEWDIYVPLVTRVLNDPQLNVSLLVVFRLLRGASNIYTYKADQAFGDKQML
jgi:hypothetical protein